MNIKGYIEGNPGTDLIRDYNSRIPYAHRMALLSDELYESAKANCHGNYTEVDPDNTLCFKDLQVVDQCLKNIYRAMILEPSCYDTPEPDLLKWDNSSHEGKPRELLSLPLHTEQWCRDFDHWYSYFWANDKAVQTALYVRKGTKEEWVRCNGTLHATGEKKPSLYTYDVQSSVDYHRNLTSKHFRALIYSGDHDMVVPHLGTEEWIHSLNLSVESAWEPWFVDGQIAGYRVKYLKNYYSLTYATVKGAGHTAPEYKPKQCFAMIKRWFSDHSL